MDVASSVLVLLFIVSLTDGNVNYNVSLEVKIDGFEKECDAPGCRYTGRIVGTVTSHGINYPIPQLCFHIWLFTYGTPFWDLICPVSLYPCEKCLIRHTACNCSGYNPLKVEFYPYRGTVFKLAVIGSKKKSKSFYPFLIPDAIDVWIWSNEFDASIKPDDWDPIYVHGSTNKQVGFGYSTNGNNQLNAGTKTVGMATLFAFILTKIIFNE